MQASASELIGVWLAIKVASQWKGWSQGFKVSGATKITGREFANVFMTGTGLSRAFAFAGARCIPFFVSADWSSALLLLTVLLTAPIAGALVLYAFIWRKMRQATHTKRPNHAMR